MAGCNKCGMSDLYDGVYLDRGICNQCIEFGMNKHFQNIRPVILCRGGKTYSGKQFRSDVPGDNIVDVLSEYEKNGVTDAIVFSLNGLIDYDLALKICSFDICLTIGGGVKDMDDVGQLFRAGAHRVAINSCLTGSDLLEDASAKWGNISAVIDVNKGLVTQCKQAFELLSVTPSIWAHRLQSRGATEIILQCINREGTKEGYDHNLIREVSTAVRVPVVAVSGCSGIPDAIRAYFHSGADAIGCGSVFREDSSAPRRFAEAFMNRDFTCGS